MDSQLVDAESQPGAMEVVDDVADTCRSPPNNTCSDSDNRDNDNNLVSLTKDTETAEPLSNSNAINEEPKGTDEDVKDEPVEPIEPMDTEECKTNDKTNNEDNSEPQSNETKQSEEPETTDLAENTNDNENKTETTESKESVPEPIQNQEEPQSNETKPSEESENTDLAENTNDNENQTETTESKESVPEPIQNQEEPQSNETKPSEKPENTDPSENKTDNEDKTEPTEVNETVPEPIQDQEDIRRDQISEEPKAEEKLTTDKEKTDSDSDEPEAEQNETAKDKENEDSHQETEFVDPEKDEDNDKDDSHKNNLMEEDPIASDVFETHDLSEGSDAELCIIPDSERVITEEEKEAAATITPLKDITSADPSIEEEKPSTNIIVSKFEGDVLQVCKMCLLQRKVKYTYEETGEKHYICDDNCLSEFKTAKTGLYTLSWEETGLRVKDFTKVPNENVEVSKPCHFCEKNVPDLENLLNWELYDFCDDVCLKSFQLSIGSKCSKCDADVKLSSLGKYAVRFGNKVRQFCTGKCLEMYKKHVKTCSYCQRDMSGSTDGFLAPVGDKGQFKDFCSQTCMDNYEIIANKKPPKVDADVKCSVCKADKPITVEFTDDGTSNYFCGEPCFVAFNFVNNLSTGKCTMCRRNFSKAVLDEHTVMIDNLRQMFCSKSCQNIYVIARRKIVPCIWCKVKKYNFDMIKLFPKNCALIHTCSVSCLNMYQASVRSGSLEMCEYCQKCVPPLYTLQMSDGGNKNFCSYNCASSFQSDCSKEDGAAPVPTGQPKKIKRNSTTEPEATRLPMITNIQSLATNGTMEAGDKETSAKNAAVQLKQHYIFRPTPAPEQRNMATMCRVRSMNKGMTAKPTMVNKEVQTDDCKAQKILIPIPVPVYVPAPMHMFTAPVPMPVPFPLPIPIPIFIPTTRNSAAGIMKEIKKIQVKMPTDPYEAELLMMAEMVAEEKKQEPTDSESEEDTNTGADEETFSPEPDPPNFGDMLQMALKMATELDEPAVDLEGALTASTITAQQTVECNSEENVDDPQPIQHHMMDQRGKKRPLQRPKQVATPKRKRRITQISDIPIMMPQGAAAPASQAEPAEKPDANMCLKYTFGVNAWKQWVTTKNAELEKSVRKLKLFKTEILQLTSDELNYSLCLFVKEVRKPNGTEYAPDTIYYLCLGIQQYLFENGRIDNIFCDPYYEKFTDCLDEVAKKFSVLYNDSHYIVTRVEEEHLWESKQLGAHSPHVLLSTLMFFNTKHFNLTTVDEHMQLSFSHIMKHWKRNPNQPGASKAPGSRNVLLRFYPPQSAIQNNLKKKKVYEQQENEDNPLRCPVKLYEFYLSKCPESVKTRNDVFYLQPERSCVPDSPVWYSTMPLPKEALEKMLHRVKMVKEINVALLTS